MCLFTRCCHFTSLEKMLPLRRNAIDVVIAAVTSAVTIARRGNIPTSSFAPVFLPVLLLCRIFARGVVGVGRCHAPFFLKDSATTRAFGRLGGGGGGGGGGGTRATRSPQRFRSILARLFFGGSCVGLARSLFC